MSEQLVRDEQIVLLFRRIETYSEAKKTFDKYTLKLEHTTNALERQLKRKQEYRKQLDDAKKKLRRKVDDLYDTWLQMGMDERSLVIAPQEYLEGRNEIVEIDRKIACLIDEVSKISERLCNRRFEIQDKIEFSQRTMRYIKNDILDANCQRFKEYKDKCEELKALERDAFQKLNAVQDEFFLKFLNLKQEDNLDDFVLIKVDDE